MADADSKAGRREYLKRWREENREKMRQYHAEYYKQNKERFQLLSTHNYRANKEAYKRRARNWEAENPERRRELEALYRKRNQHKLKEKARRDWSANKEKRNARKRQYRRERPDLAAHHCRLRQTRKQQATPPWADLGAIKAVYAEAARLKKETGMAWHVDHDIPLKHPLVCGLHVHANLRVIPGPANQAKGNAFAV